MDVFNHFVSLRDMANVHLRLSVILTSLAKSVSMETKTVPIPDRVNHRGITCRGHR